MAAAGLTSFLEEMIRRNVSDLILTEGQAPILRLVGDLVPLNGHSPLTSEKIWEFASELLGEEQRKAFLNEQEIDISYGLPGQARFRVNVFRQRGAVGIVIRMLPQAIPTLESLGVPEIVKRWLLVPHGLIIITGPTGSGKSTTQAATIGYLNQNKPYHVVTIEDPIEFTHPHGTCTIEQREIGKDTRSFAGALRRVFRQSPDVIMIGEMRDLETFETALQLAETGHLVLATLHTGDTAQAISRIVDVFPPEQQQQVRVQLSHSLVGVLVQQLVPQIDGRGRVLATEVMEANAAVRNLIRMSELAQLYSLIQTHSAEGMITMNGSLLNLFKEGKISLEKAMLFTTRQKELEQLAGREIRIYA